MVVTSEALNKGDNLLNFCAVYRAYNADNARTFGV